MNIFKKLKTTHKTRSGALDLLKYIGPGLLVTVGFIDPGNWLRITMGSNIFFHYVDYHPT